MAHNQRLLDSQIKEDAINEAHSTNRRNANKTGKSKGIVHPCAGTEALYRPYGP